MYLLQKQKMALITEERFQLAVFSFQSQHDGEPCGRSMG